MKAKLSVGSDPEMMLYDRGGRLKSAIPVVKATKESKIDLGRGKKLFYDNVLVEMNIPTSYSEEDLIANLRETFQAAAKKVHPLVMSPTASANYPASECKHRDALVFGCEPEYCAYEVSQLMPPVCEEGNTFRSGGGHIHLGYSEEEYPLLAPVANLGTDNEDRVERDWGRIWVVRMLDLFVGLPSLLVDHDPSSSARRRLYGKAGTHRPKEEYGVEYRATSNFWLQSPRLASLIYRLAAFTVDFVRQRKHEPMWKDRDTCRYDVKAVRETIDNSNVINARRLMETLVRRHLPADLYELIFQLSEPTRYDFYTEWKL